MDTPSGPGVDSHTFQKKLDELATTIAFKVQREGPKLPLKPAFIFADMYYLLRHSQQTYNLFFFINHDDRRKNDPYWKVAYSAVILPLIRTMIDCLYNITAILQNPGPKGYQFRESGYKKILQSLDADEQRYGGDPRWDAYIAERRKSLAFDMRANGISEAEARTAEPWPTLGRYLRIEKNGHRTPHQEFLAKLTFGFWQEYSGISHATFQGLVPIAALLAPNDLPHEHRPLLEASGERMIFWHIARVSAVLLCTLTEVQAYFKFDGARINQRLGEIWNALLRVSEIKELYDERYTKLMQDKGINLD